MSLCEVTCLPAVAHLDTPSPTFHAPPSTAQVQGTFAESETLQALGLVKAKASKLKTFAGNSAYYSDLDQITGKYRGTNKNS